MKATRKQIEEAREAAAMSARILKAHDQTWSEEWDAIVNPFDKVTWLLSDKQRKRRRPIIQAWLRAKKSYEAIAPKRESSWA